ncbi:MAG TPA: hypothetical protein VK919_13710 [Solirubrobacterales bacterium]|nr:hypothetical protein [Solirubrobacterales bacterium]
MIVVPLAWAILLLFHPGGEATEIYRSLDDEVTVWMVVHVGMLVFIPLFAVAVYLLVRGIEGTAARVSRIGLVFFVVFYGAFETLQGIGVGTLVDALNGLPEIGQATREDLVQDFAENVLFRDLGVFSSIGSLALIAAMIAAAVALRGHAGAPLSVVILLGLSGFLIGAHPPPFGPTGLAFFIIAVLLFLRSRSTAPGHAPPGPAGSASDVAARVARVAAPPAPRRR